MVSYRCTFLLLICALSSWGDYGTARAQDRSTWRWYFGKGLGMDFNTLPPVELNDGLTNSIEGTAVLSDENTGELLLYSDGNTVWDRTHTAFVTGLNPKYYSATQAAIILRQPGSTSLVHLFLVPETCVGPARHVIIDLRFRGGLGDTVSFNPNLSAQRVAEKVAAVSAANGRDWWIVFRGVGIDSSAFLSYLLSNSGLRATPVRSAVGQVLNPAVNTSFGIGQLVFTRDGTRLASANEMADIELFDFDRASGHVSNPKLYVPNTMHLAYGAAFSPNGRYLYSARQGYMADTIVRFDLQASDVQASRTVVASTGNTFGQLLLARDNKIYVAEGSLPYLGAIMDADSVQPRFNEQEYSLTSTASQFIGLPNFPQRIATPIDADTTTLNAPSYACSGSTITLELYSNLGDSLNVRYVFEDGSDTTLAVKAPRFRLERTLGQRSQYSCTVFVHGFGVGASTRIDTLRCITNAWMDCCGELVRNGNFLAISAGGQCFPVEYETDFNFRSSQNSPCLFTIDKPGQIASQGNAQYGNKAWSGRDHSSISSFILYGEPIPNTEMRAWYERIPVWVNTRYHFRVWIKNVEEYKRFDTTGVDLQFALQVTQAGIQTEIKRVAYVSYSQGWMELSGDFLSSASGDAEVAVAVLCKTNGLGCYGFAIDDISVVPLTTLILDAGPPLRLCRGSAAQVQTNIVNASRIEWSPKQGLSDWQIAQPMVSCDSSCTYTVSAWDGNGCMHQKFVTINVVEPQHPKLIADRLGICYGDTIIVSLDQKVASIEWTDHSSSDTLIVLRSGDYAATGIDSLGCQFSTDTLHIADLGGLSLQLSLPDDHTLAVGAHERIEFVLLPWTSQIAGKNYVARFRFRKEAFTVDPNFVVAQDSVWTTVESLGVLHGQRVQTAIVLQGLLNHDAGAVVTVDSFFVDTRCPVNLQTDSMLITLQSCWLKSGFVFDAPTRIVSLYPQPVDNMLHVLIEHPKDNALRCALYNAMGACVAQLAQTVQASEQTELQFNTESLLPGWYLLRCELPGGPQCLPFLVLHSY